MTVLLQFKRHRAKHVLVPRPPTTNKERAVCISFLVLSRWCLNCSKTGQNINSSPKKGVETTWEERRKSLIQSRSEPSDPL